MVNSGLLETAMPDYTLKWFTGELWETKYMYLYIASVGVVCVMSFLCCYKVARFFVFIYLFNVDFTS